MTGKWKICQFFEKVARDTQNPLKIRHVFSTHCWLFGVRKCFCSANKTSHGIQDTSLKSRERLNMIIIVVRHCQEVLWSQTQNLLIFDENLRFWCVLTRNPNKKCVFENFTRVLFLIFQYEIWVIWQNYTNKSFCLGCRESIGTIYSVLRHLKKFL